MLETVSHPLEVQTGAGQNVRTLPQDHDALRTPFPSPCPVTLSCGTPGTPSIRCSKLLLPSQRRQSLSRERETLECVRRLLPSLQRLAPLSAIPERLRPASVRPGLGARGSGRGLVGSRPVAVRELGAREALSKAWSAWGESRGETRLPWRPRKGLGDRTGFRLCTLAPMVRG